MLYTPYALEDKIESVSAQNTIHHRIKCFVICWIFNFFVFDAMALLHLHLFYINYTSCVWKISGTATAPYYYGDDKNNYTSSHTLYVYFCFPLSLSLYASRLLIHIR